MIAAVIPVQAFPVLTGLTVDKITNLFEFPTFTLPTTKDKPTYARMVDVRNKMYRNLVAVESSFGGDGNDHLGVIIPAGPYRTQAGEDWVVPTPDLNLVPTHAQAADDDTKKKEIHLFIRRKTDIKMAKNSHHTHPQDAP